MYMHTARLQAKFYIHSLLYFHFQLSYFVHNAPINRFRAHARGIRCRSSNDAGASGWTYKSSFWMSGCGW